MRKSYLVDLIVIFLFVPMLSWATSPPTQPAQPKDASRTTMVINEVLLQTLPFHDRESFKNAERGFIAPLPDNGVIRDAQGRVVWDLRQYDFIQQGGRAPHTVNPSLWRQAQLIMKGGLYKVSDHIYQVRAADLSNITFIEGENGIVVIDPLISTETAQAALNFYYQHRPKKPVVAVIYTHSHVDHYGGVRGVISEDDVKNGKVKVVAPEGFMQHAVAENVMAGNAMSRRASYMYGNLLPKSVKGQVGAGLGPTTSTGTISLIAPNEVITKDGQSLTLAGLKFVFYLAPDSEAPSTLFFYVPAYKTLCTAEDTTHVMHNTYSLRGAKIRDPLLWSKYINEVIHLWGNKTDILIAPHHWPIWGQENVVKHLKMQRDMYRYINDQTLNLANKGYTKEQIAEMVKMPKELNKYWSNRGYYGTLNHNVKATYVKYLGWFNGNPATLYVLPPEQAAKHYVEYMGGADAVIEKARKDYAAGHYRWVAEVMHQVVFADPSNQAARDLEADALEQLGYQAESGPWRNFYLSGAKELREGMQRVAVPQTASPDTIRAMSPTLVFDFMGVRLNAQKAAGKKIVLNFVFTDTNQKYILELQHSTLNNISGVQAEDADATITLTRAALDNILLGQKTLEQEVKAGAIKIDGDQDKLTELLGMLDKFDFWFHIMTPNTKPSA